VRYGFDTQRLFDVVFTSESSKQAEVGLKPDKIHWEWALDELGIPQAERADFIKEFWAGDRMDYELLDFIQSLRPAICTGLLSNAWLNTRSNVTRRWGALEPYFDVTIFSAELGMRKPAPEFFHWLLERLDVQPGEAIFVDDYGKNIEAARELGLQAVKFCSTEQAILDVQALINHSVPGK
jgi:epoxide hydrolase-like predicted phosphatase